LYQRSLIDIGSSGSASSPLQEQGAFQIDTEAVQ